MAAFVLVPGAWGGAWALQWLAPYLREANDPPLDWLIDRIVTFTGVPESEGVRGDWSVLESLCEPTHEGRQGAPCFGFDMCEHPGTRSPRRMVLSVRP